MNFDAYTALKSAAIGAVLALGMNSQASAQAAFYLSPSATPDGDLAFIEAAGAEVFEENLNSYQESSIESFSLGGVEVEVRLLDPSGAVATGAPGVPLKNQIWGISESVGGVPGAVFGNTILNGSNGGVAGQLSEWRHRIRFQFSEPVRAFGAWLFDDMNSQNHAFVLHAYLAGGVVHSSPVLDNPSQAGWVIDGFAGVAAPGGIESVVIESLASGFYEIDGIQLSPMCGSETHYGAGSPGAGGLVPTISATSACLGSSSFSFTVANAVGGTSGLLLVGFASTSVPVSGGQLLVVPSLSWALSMPGAMGVAGAGSASVELALPANPSLEGVAIYAQAGVLDPNGIGGVALTDGMSLTLGLP